MNAREFEQYQGINTSSKSQSTQAMNAISREEFNARIETIETRMDARIDGVSGIINAFLSAQAEREKTQLERDKRYDVMWEQVQKGADESRDVAKQVISMRRDYWAVAAINFFGVLTIVVGAHFANQANILVAIQTTLSAVQAGRDASAPKTDMLIPLQSQ